MPARVLVGIPHYNDPEFLELILQSIDWYTQLDEPFDVVICDDGSRPKELEDARRIAAKFGAYFIEHAQNEGIPATWNHLTQALGAKSEIVVLLNNDMLMVPHWLRSVVYFLDANKDNPTLGTVSLQPFQVPASSCKEMFRLIVPMLGHSVFRMDDLLSGKEKFHDSLFAHDSRMKGQSMDEKVGEGQGIAAVMCPCGCSFAFRREHYNLTTGFDEQILAFHEESDIGTQLAQLGRASFCLAYPRPYHVGSGTFMNSPELEADKRMQSSRRYYRQKWGVPVQEQHSGFDWVNAKFMPLIPKIEYKFLAPDYNQEPEVITQRGGEKVFLPKLVEQTQVC